MSLLAKLLGQCRRPRGWIGRRLAHGMNRAHAPMTGWVLSRIPLAEVRSVLDVGCGGGAALGRLAARLPGAELHGVDYSADSLRVAARRNRRLIRQGRISLRPGDVSRLPFDDGRFDLAVSIECHCFWPDLHHGLGEIRRALRTGGLAAIGGGVYFSGRFDRRNRKLAAIGSMNCQTLSELGDALLRAGYGEVEIHEERRRGWFVVTGRRE